MFAEGVHGLAGGATVRLHRKSRRCLWRKEGRLTKEGKK